MFGRRARVLAASLAARIPAGASVLDVGCGDGTVGHLIAEIDPTISIRGVEVAPRPRCRIACLPFDGRTIPLDDASVDVCLFVDVLHHTLNIPELLAEARRVSRRHVLVKDHACETALDRAVLSFMDWVGNRPHGVSLPYNYQRDAEWRRHLRACGLRLVSWQARLPLYPFPFDHVFGRGLHFIALLEK